VRIYVCAGEDSGDALGAHMIAALAAKGPVVARGLAGPAMREAGVQVFADACEATAAGLVEVLEAVPRIAGLLGRLERDAVAFAPDVVLTIDSPGLMLRLARRLRRRGMPVVHLVAPQVWAWRPGRVKRVGASVDALLCLFPHEPALFEGFCEAVSVGHPLLGTLPRSARGDRSESVRSTPTFALCPGSRPADIRIHWPVLREVGRLLRDAHPGCRLVVPRAPSPFSSR